MLLLLTESHIKTDKVCVTNEFVSFVFRKRHKRRYHILIYIEKKKNKVDFGIKKMRYRYHYNDNFFSQLCCMYVAYVYTAVVGGV